MLLEFNDGSQIDVKKISGGPRLILGTMRDTLNIEVVPTTCSHEQLKRHFKDNPKTSVLYTYTESADEEGNVSTNKTEIGQGYKIFVSITDEIRELPKEPGKLEPIETEELYIVTIAQQTYQEYLLENQEQNPET